MFAYGKMVSSIEKWLNCSIWSIDGTLTSTTSVGKSGPRSNGNEGFFLVRFYGISTIVSYLMQNPFLYTYTVLIQAIQFSIRTQFSSIWSIDRTLSGATTPGQSGPGSDGNKEFFRIPQTPALLEPHHQIV